MVDSDSDWDDEEAEEEHSSDELDAAVDSQDESEKDDSFSEEPRSNTTVSSEQTPQSTKPKPKRKRTRFPTSTEKPSNFQKRAHQVLLLDEDEEDGQKRPKKLRRVNFDNEQCELDDLPSFERATDRGGYAHTKTSRMKISAANKGKMPWNKGKNRSDAAKEKISAGVRARNHAILMEKLKKLGMSEEEWLVKKREVKLLREKVRKARLAVRQHEEEMKIEREKQDEIQFQQAIIDAFERENLEAERNAKMVPPKKAEVQGRSKGRKNPPQSTDADASKPTSTDNLIDRDNKDSQVIRVGRFKALAAAQTPKNGFTDKAPPRTSPEALDPYPQDEVQDVTPFRNKVLLSTREIKWTPHPLGLEGSSYVADCPVGGPGGLICCTTCTSKYSQYLSSTFQDLEAQQISSLGEEVEEIMDYSRATTKLLAESIEAAKEKQKALL